MKENFVSQHLCGFESRFSVFVVAAATDCPNIYNLWPQLAALVKE